MAPGGFAIVAGFAQIAPVGTFGVAVIILKLHGLIKRCLYLFYPGNIKQGKQRTGNTRCAVREAGERPVELFAAPG
jgi:hypothetical protein